MNNIYKFSAMLISVILILLISNLNKDSYVNLLITSMFIIFILLLINNYVNLETKENMENVRPVDLLNQNNNSLFISNNSNNVTYDDAEINDFNSKNDNINILLNNLNCYDFKPSDNSDIQYNILYRTSDLGDDINDDQVLFKN